LRKREILRKLTLSSESDKENAIALIESVPQPKMHLHKEKFCVIKAGQGKILRH
jgi:hypothetical protein